MKKGKIFTDSGKIYVTWILTFLIIMLILTFGGVSLYLNSVKYTENEMKNTNLMRLGYVREMIDNEVSAATILSSKLCVDPYITQISKMKDASEMSEIEMMKVLDNFALYKAVSGKRGEFYVWFRNIDLCLTSTSKYNKELFSEIFCRQQKIFSKENIEFFERGGSSRNFLFSASEDKTKRTLINVTVISTDRSGAPMVAIIIPLDNKVFYMNDDVMKNTYVLVEDSDKNIIMNTAERNINIFVDGGENDLRTCGEGKERVVYSYIKSNVMDWKYIVAMDYGKFRISIRNQSAIFAMLLFFELLFVFLAICLFWNKNYTSIKEILNILPHNRNDENEFMLIKDNILQMKSTHNKNMDIIERQQNILKYIFIGDLIANGEKRFDRLDAELEKYGIRFLSDCFCVLIIYIFDNGIFKKAEFDTFDDDNSDELIEYSVKNVVEELCNEENLGYVTSASGMLCCLLNFNGKKSDNLDTACKIARKTVGFFEKYYNFQMKISIGGIVYGGANISKSFENAFSNLECRIYDDDKKVMTYDESKEEIDTKQSMILRLENDVVAHIKEGRTDDAVNSFRMAISEIKEKSISGAVRQKHLNSFLRFMMEYIQTINKKSDGAFTDETNTLLNIILSDTEIWNETGAIEGVIRRICDYQASISEGGSHKNSMYQKMLKYIGMNYMNTNLTSQMVADEFKLSVSYFLRFFKENAGCGFLDYLHKVRIEKAKEMLKVNSYDLKSIHTACGYASYTTFMRAFKKITGMTPQKYRDRL